MDIISGETIFKRFKTSKRLQSRTTRCSGPRQGSSLPYTAYIYTYEDIDWVNLIRNKACSSHEDKQEYLDQSYTEIRRSDATLTKEEYDQEVLKNTKDEQAAYSTMATPNHWSRHMEETGSKRYQMKRMKKYRQHSKTLKSAKDRFRRHAQEKKYKDLVEKERLQLVADPVTGTLQVPLQ